MRAIDADAFAEFLKNAVKRQKYEGTKIEGLLTVADVLEAVIAELDGTSFVGFKNAPTIELERKKGKWITSSVRESMLWKCDQCGYDCGAHSFNFCPNCGADMRGGLNE